VIYFITRSHGNDLRLTSNYSGYFERHVMLVVTLYRSMTIGHMEGSIVCSLVSYIGDIATETFLIGLRHAPRDLFYYSGEKLEIEKANLGADSMRSSNKIDHVEHASGLSEMA
jgi:hypothetical protein